MAILSISDLKALVQNTIYNNSTNDIQGDDVQVALINAIDTLDSLEGFVNVHKANGQTTITAYGSKAAARAAVPTDAHFEGVVIAYKLSTGWIIEQNLNTTAGTWNNDASWQTIGPVSVSQDTTTGHTDIQIGQNKFPLFIKLFAITAPRPQGMPDGAIYYNTIDKQLMKCYIGGGYDVIPFYDGVIYIYNGNLYVWNGTDLEQVTDRYIVPLNRLSDSSQFARKTNTRTQQYISGYIDTDGSIHSSSASVYFSFKAYKGETIVIEGLFGNQIAAISTSADGTTITPRIISDAAITTIKKYQYTLENDCIVFVCFTNPAQTSQNTYLQVLSDLVEGGLAQIDGLSKLMNSATFSRRSNMAGFDVKSGYISYTDGSINPSSLSVYFSFKAYKGETVVIEGRFGQNICAIGTSIDGTTITPRVKATGFGDEKYSYTLTEDCIVFVCFALSSLTGIPVYMQIIEQNYLNDIETINTRYDADKPFYTIVNMAGKGNNGYVNYNTGAIDSSTISKYIIMPLKKGQIITAEVFNVAGVAALAKQVNGGAIVPLYNSTGALNAYTYLCDEDCDIYISYRNDSSDVCNVNVVTTYPSEIQRKGVEIYVGNIPHTYYECQQTQYNVFPNGANTLTSDVYTAFDALVDNVHLFKEKIGEASDGQDLFAYKFIPYRVSNEPIYAIKKSPCIFIIAGQHGFEKGNVLGLYYFIKDLMTNAESSPVLEYIHSMLEIRFVPVANPSGFDINNYLNSNGVNLNRNWPVINWASQGEPGDTQYGGVAPLDQPETDAMNTYYLTFADRCVLVIDSHSQGSGNVDSTQNINWIALNSIKDDYTRKILYGAYAHIADITEHFNKDYAAHITTPGVCCRITYGENPTALIYGNADVHFMQYGNLGCTLEGMCGFPTGTLFSADVQKANAEIICNFVMNVLRQYEP